MLLFWFLSHNCATKRKNENSQLCLEYDFFLSHSQFQGYGKLNCVLLRIHVSKPKQNKTKQHQKILNKHKTEMETKNGGTLKRR